METETNIDIFAAKSTVVSLLGVDDEVVTRNLCRDVATDTGLQVHIAAPTDKTIEILDQYPIDIVVTDLHVPEIGRLELLTEGGTQCMPIVPIQIVERLSTIAKAV